MWIVDDDFEDSLPLPRGERDIPLMIADRSFDRRNQLTDPFKGGLQPPADGIAGQAILVNGVFMPHHEVAPCRYRLRILNVSQFRTYNLLLSNGAPMVQIGSDSGLMPRPVRRREILHRPRRAGRGGRRLRRLRRREGRAAQRPAWRPGPDGSRAYAGALMQFRVAPGRSPTGPGSRGACDRCPPGRSSRRARSREPDRRWEIAVGGLIKTTWTINGRTFNPARADAFPVLGTTEVWEFANRTKSRT